MKNINWIDHLLNFVSVILGVSMAFYASNWSDDRKNKDESIRIVESLISEIEQDLRVYENHQLTRNRKQSENLNRAIGKIQKSDLDSLPHLIQRGIGYTNYYPRKATFNSITSSGKFGLIEDYDLQIQISSYYEATAVEARYRGETQVDFYKEHFMPMIIESTDLLNPKIEDIDLKKLTNMLLLYQNMINAKVSKYEEVVEKGKALSDSLAAYKDQLL
ncbi:MAG: DUF6090 family protein [Cytophagales bacterium]|nr:DUF6090 family protein [Cytophagales bacterium]